MKKFTIVLLTLFALFSCEKETQNGNDIIWDIWPVNIVMYVNDINGNDLISPSNPNNILKNDIKIVYDGMEFPLGVDMSEQTMSKAYLAVLSGLHLGKYGNDYYLEFGEFDGAKNWNDTFEIFWGDGTSDKISFTRNFKWDKEGNPDISNEALYLNDKKVEDKLIIIK